jgi:hypothetical protein
MGGAWYTEIADELARCLIDARDLAEACETLLGRASELDDEDAQKEIMDAVVAPAAVARVLIDLIDQPQQLVLAAATLCRDSSRAALTSLCGYPNELVGETCAALQACVESCAVLIDVT